jgi:antirestriction protein ArdC
MSRTDAPRRDLHADITNQLIAAIEADPGNPVLPWRRRGGALHMPINAVTEKAYSGINILNLWVMAEVKGYETPVWATYRQWAERGAQVRKGETASLIVFYKQYEVTPAEGAEGDDGKRRVAKGSAVFNASQVDGYVAPGPPADLGPIERIGRAETFVAATKASIQHGGDRAFFRPSTDHIQMPDEGLFAGTDTMSRTEGYYATLLHELVHWSGAKPRLDRDLSGRFGDQAYAAEELVAEVGAAFLCAELGITLETRADHAQYLANWLRLFKDDNRAIFTAAAKASQAVSYLRMMP